MSAAMKIQHGGTHYLKQKIQPVEFIAANNWDFFSGNTLKYLTRWRDKAGLLDLDKAEHFVHMRIALGMEKYRPHLDGRRGIWMNEYIRENQIEVALDPVLLALEQWVMTQGAHNSRVAFTELLGRYIRNMKLENE